MGEFLDILEKQPKSNERFIKELPTEKPAGFFDILNNSQFPLSVPQEKKKVPDLRTLEGVLQKAKEEGLEEKAEKITKFGEEEKQIFSGGFIRDIFDVITIPQYAVAGAAKKIVTGEGGIKQGIIERASFTDPELLGRYGSVGKTLGFITDIVADPLMIFPTFGIGERILRGTGAISKSILNTKAGKIIAEPVGRAFVYRYGQDPVYKQLAESTIKQIAKRQEKALELVKPIAELSAEEQRLITSARKSGNLDILSEGLKSKAAPAFQELDKLGKEAVDLGFLDEAVYNENVGKYIARLYRTKEAPEVGEIIVKGLERKPVRIDIERFKKRTDIPEDIREAMGEILEVGYPVGKSLVQLSQAVERGKFFRQVAERWGSDEILEGMIKLPENKRLGALSGKAVPRPIYDDIQEIARIKTPLQRRVGKAVAFFKFGKVIMNPATHARNIMSNFILNSFEGLNPYRVDIYAKAASEIIRKGSIYQEAKNAGLGLDTFAAAEIKDLLLDPTIPQKTRSIFSAAGQNLSDLYQKEEEFAKMAQFIYQRNLGKSTEEAFQIAERATFNYAQVTPFIRKLRESAFGMPFITFTYKVTPQAARTLVTRPATISPIGKARTYVESFSPPEEIEKERRVEPEWIRQGMFVRLPQKDKYGRTAYFDLTYILPFGDLLSGQLLRVEKDETFIQAALDKFPLLNIGKELTLNKDFFGNEIIKGTSIEPDEIGLDVLKYIVRQYGPNISYAVPERILRAWELEKQAELEPEKVRERTQRTIGQELSSALLGLKVNLFNFGREEERRAEEARQKILKLLEAVGKVREFKIPFIPK